MLYEVEKILKKRIINGKTQYLIKWDGYSEKDASWEPLSNLKDAADCIKEYED